MDKVECVVVGAGVVGLAAARRLARAGREVIVVEAAGDIGTGTSSRNSEVIHAGIYYPAGSLMARMCVAGKKALYAYCDERGIPYRRCGKLIVATEESEIPALEKLARQAEINGVEGVAWLSGAEALALEPQLRAAAAIESRESGVFDAHGYMEALEGEIETRGGAVVLNAPFEGAARDAEGFIVRVGGEAPTEISTKALVIAAGLGAQACAATIDAFPAARIPALHYGKGNYFALHGVKAPFSRLIYPPPIPGALGTHYRRDLGGVARLGPDLQFVDHEDYVVDPARAGAFYETVRRFWPGLPDGALAPDYAGIRPKLHGPGEAQGDFVIDDSVENLVCLFGIESPGLTSSLAIGEDVAARLS